ncbi:MAG: DNA translocase FtsK 4TM domain-containing protein [Candidatus Yonathbacteria bacterium]|nr:DNA translocase FtsK 4TM domain-containing protein [Candidatus Yonathbacteria bacterium]
MAKKDRRNGEKRSTLNIVSGLKEETRHAVFSIIFFAFAVLFVLAPLSKAGIVGHYLFAWLSALLGVGYFILPVLLILLAISFLKETRPNFAISTGGGAILFMLSTLGIIDIVSKNSSGGIMGKIVSVPVLKLFDTTAGLILLTAILAASLLIMFDTRPRIAPLVLLFKKLFSRAPKNTAPVSEVEIEITAGEDGEKEPKEDSKEIKTVFGIGKKKSKEISVDFIGKGTFNPPPLSLLEGDRGKPGVGDIKANANIIKRTLQNFGIDVEMDEVTIGPSVTRYALKPAEGVRLSKILSLQNNLELALAAHPVRIEAPIPGKSLVGIELPNNTKTTVGLGTLLSDEAYQKSLKSLLLALGKDISGNAHFADLGKMPHLLIAGATGSGKSVTIHTIVNSLLFRNPPENMRFVMIDPKRVELTLYNGIPHLLTPVITDAKKAILALKWAAKEMERRYNILEGESVRDIASYHKTIVEPALKKTNNRQPTTDNETGEAQENYPEKMPYIIIIIDELADIMSSYPRELESAIVRLAQMSRAVGIHLILSTQRPSVNIITGLIKANIPARVALQVTSQIDSRTILDTGGAEKLLGAGDMLYISGEMSKPVRIQSAYISETEVKKVVKFLRNEYGDAVPEEITLTATPGKNSLFESSFDDEEFEDDDELYEEAREIVIETGKASSSYLQRRLKVGYARAARLLDMLEEKGVVGPGEGSKPREVLEKRADLRGTDAD